MTPTFAERSRAGRAFAQRLIFDPTTTPLSCSAAISRDPSPSTSASTSSVFSPSSGARRTGTRGTAEKSSGEPGIRYLPDARMLDLGKERIGGRAARVFLDQLAEGLVRAPRNVGAGEGLADRGEVARGEPRTQQRGDQVAGLEAPGLGVEVVAGRVFDARTRLADPGGVFQRVPLTRRERDHHHAPPVAGLEIVAERAVKIVAVLLLVAAAEFAPPRYGRDSRPSRTRRPRARDSPVDPRRSVADGVPRPAARRSQACRARCPMRAGCCSSGSARLRGPVAHGKPVAGLTV